MIRPGFQFPFSWSPDGRFLVFNEASPTGGALDLWLASRKGDATPLLATSFDERMARFHPTGRWLAYQSLESGNWHVYVGPYPGLAGSDQVSTNKGRDPVWSRDGRELFYLEGTRLRVATFDPSTGKPGIPHSLFDGYVIDFSGTNYDVSPDGQRFVMVQRTQRAARVPELHLVQNWFEELKRLAPMKSLAASCEVNAAWPRYPRPLPIC